MQRRSKSSKQQVQVMNCLKSVSHEVYNELEFEKGEAKLKLK